MKKMIILLLIVISAYFLAVTFYKPSFNIFDIADIRRSQLEIRELNLYQKIKYDINRDFKVDGKDLNIIKAFIMNE